MPTSIEDVRKRDPAAVSQWQASHAEELKYLLDEAIQKGHGVLIIRPMSMADILALKQAKHAMNLEDRQTGYVLHPLESLDAAIRLTVLTPPTNISETYAPGAGVRVWLTRRYEATAAEKVAETLGGFLGRVSNSMPPAPNQGMLACIVRRGMTRPLPGGIPAPQCDTVKLF